MSKVIVSVLGLLAFDLVGFILGNLFGYSKLGINATKADIPVVSDRACYAEAVGIRCFDPKAD